MSIIKNLAKMCVDNIKHDQNNKTAQDRITALLQLEIAMNQAKDDQVLIEKFSAIAKNVHDHGHFGWYGPEGSTFLKHTDTFLKQAKFIQKLATEEKLSLSGVRELGLYTAHAIGLTQNKFTPQNELSAKKEFLAELKDKMNDDTYLISLAKKLCDAIPNPSSFWSLGAYNNYFLIYMQDYIAQAEKLSAMHMNEITQFFDKIIQETISTKNPAMLFHKNEYKPVSNELKPEEKYNQAMRKAFN